MEFSATPLTAPPNSVPCLLNLTLGGEGAKHAMMMAVAVDPTAYEPSMAARKFYWRASVGVDSPGKALIITPLDNPPNPLLDGPPVKSENTAKPECDTSTLSGKIAHLFHSDKTAPVAKPVTDWPGVIDGKPLAGIRVPIKVLDTNNHVVETETLPAAVSIPVRTEDLRDSATLRFEFDSWLTAKADLDVLVTQIYAELKLEHPEDVARDANPHLPSVAAQNGFAPDSSMTVSQEGLKTGRDNDGSTHPSGDAEYDPNWKKSWVI